MEPVATWINQPILVRLVPSGNELDRELFQTLSFDLSLGARLSFEIMVGTEPQVRPMRLLEWGLFIKGRGCLKRHLLDYTLNFVYELTLVMDRG